ncbi:MAG: glycosyltransferase [Salibacteraceae bacterium]
MLLDNAFESDSRVSKEITQLREHGFEVVLICISDDGLPSSEVLVELRVYRWIESIYLRPFHTRFRGKIKKLASQILGLKFDILHCHDMFLLPVAKEILKTRKDVHFIYDSHEYFRGLNYNKSSTSIINSIKGFLVWKYFLKIEKSMARRAVAVICTSEAISAKLQRDFELRRVPITVRNIPAKDFFSNSSHESMDIYIKCDIPRNHIVMVQSGNVYQSWDDLIRTFNVVTSIPNLHFVLINNKKIAKKIEDSIQQNNIWKNRIHVIDYNSATLYDLLSSADFGLVHVLGTRWLSQYLTSPNRTFEYTLSGIPFVSNPQDTSEFMGREFGHVVMFKDLDDMRIALSEIMKSLVQFKSKAKKASKAFLWENEFKPIVDLYKEISKQSIIQNDSK